MGLSTVQRLREDGRFPQISEYFAAVGYGCQVPIVRTNRAHGIATNVDSGLLVESRASPPLFAHCPAPKFVIISPLMAGLLSKLGFGSPAEVPQIVQGDIPALQGADLAVAY